MGDGFLLVDLLDNVFITCEPTFQSINVGTQHSYFNTIKLKFNDSRAVIKSSCLPITTPGRIIFYNVSDRQTGGQVGWELEQNNTRVPNNLDRKKDRGINYLPS